MRLRRSYSIKWLGWSVWLTASALYIVAPAASARERFEVPEGCGSESAFESEFERLMGTPAPDDVPESLVIEALGREGYELRLLVRNERRVLRDPDCRTLWRSAIVISAAAIGLEAPMVDPAGPAPTLPESPPSGVPAESPSPAPPQTPGTPTPEPKPSTPVQTTPSAPARGAASASPPPARPAPSARAKRPRRPSIARTHAARRSRPPPPKSSTSQRPANARAPSSEPANVRYGVDVGAGVSGGVLPGLGAVLGLGARVEAWPGAASLTLSYWPERSASRDGRGVDLSAVGVRAAAAFWVATGVQVLGGVELNRLAGVGLEGVSGRSSDAAWQLAPTLGLSLIPWDHRYLRIELGALGRASLIRPAFVVTGYGELYQVPVFGADVIIRGVWLFP